MCTGVTSDPVGGSPPDDAVVAVRRSASVALLAAEAERALHALAVATADLRTVRDEDTFESVRAVAAGQRFLDSAQLSLVGELDARSLPERTTGLATRQWLGHEHQLSRPAAGRQVHLARKCRRDLPVMAAALRDGLLTLDHVAFVARRVTDRVHDIVVELQPLFVELVEGRRFEKWAQLVDEMIRMADPDGGFHPDPEHDRASMNLGPDGQLHVELDLGGSDAAETHEILLAELERRHRAHRKVHKANPEHVIPSRARLLAEAHTELMRRGHAAGPGTTAPVTDVTLTISAADPLHATTPGGVVLQDGTTRLLTCDAKVHALIVDSLGVPLDLGTAVSRFTPGQRRAILARDGGCIHPGCDAPPAWTQIHHVEERGVGGPTDLGNGAAACPIHHAVWHTDGWSMLPDMSDGTQGFIITTPSGRELRSQRHGQPRPRIGV